MNDSVANLRAAVIQKAQDPSFIHHQWFVTYHLEIVEKIAFELCEKYPEADRELVQVLVWLHDIGKMYNFSNQYAETPIRARELLEEHGFLPDFTNKAVEYLVIFDKKMEIDLHSAPLEVQIGVSADALSHFYGPFFHLYWYENPQKPFEELMEDNRRKAQKDWDRKLVLPEARAAAEARYKLVCEQSGELPEKFLEV